MGKRLLCIWIIGLIGGLTIVGADNKVVVVEKGDTLYSIGRTYNVSVQTLIETNGIVNPRSLKAGTRIKVPNTYIVEKGDTLYGIARRNSFSLDKLCNLNGIDKNTIIKVGQVLILPAAAEDRKKSAESTRVTQQGLTTKSDSTSVSDGSSTGHDSSDDPTDRTSGSKISESGGSVKSGKNTSDSDSKRLSYSEVVSGKDVLWPHTGTRTRLNGKLHGTQIKGSRGDKVVSVSSGKVVWVAPYRGYGTLVMVETSSGMIYAYGGNEATYVDVGDAVEAGTVLGRLGINPIEKTAKVFFFVYKDGKPVDPATAPRG